MKSYYFTFGHAHKTKNGLPMRDYWVRVEATDYLEARYIFIDEFSSKYMPAPNKWCGEYGEEDFDPGWYPKGEFMHLKQKSYEVHSAI